MVCVLGTCRLLFFSCFNTPDNMTMEGVELEDGKDNRKGCTNLTHMTSAIILKPTVINEKKLQGRTQCEAATRFLIQFHVSVFGSMQKLKFALIILINNYFSRDKGAIALILISTEL